MDRGEQEGGLRQERGVDRGENFYENILYNTIYIYDFLCVRMDTHKDLYLHNL